MSTIAINTSKLPIPFKLDKGQEFITKGTGNPLVPGNAPYITVLTTAQAALAAAHTTYEQAKNDLKELLAVRNAALATWNGAVTGLASFTESATGGNPVGILSSGFDVKAEPSPTQPVGQVVNVTVNFTGQPGYSEVRWKRVSNADAYVVECSPEPITATSWKNLDTVSELKYIGNGATPGQQCWYRVAAVNREGRGLWSLPVLRPVM